ncbi:hypothetical protein F5Y05DRAFT_321828 [Hypoxylon sp. FL0543]|nr:hypothetical protein F5Y05DRAFT_321828 [Hypoxylon sp. FL0543]
MAPPPATPTPHRFLVPKRSQPKNETPKAFQSGGQQFHATPRFSLHSTPRGPSGGGPGLSQHPSSSIATPAPARPATGTGAGAFYRPTQRNTDPINDIIDSSPPFVEQQHSGSFSNQQDPIEVFDVDTDVDAVPESSPVRGESSNRGESSEGEQDLGHRSPKRRRISISSDFGMDDCQSSQHERTSMEENLFMHDEMDIQSSLPDFYEPNNDEADEESDAAFSPLHSKSSGSAQQPTFQKAPRFKPVEVSEGSHRGDPLPDAFSPHRKGAKYVPGGLAAEVRDWFVDVWAGANAAGAGSARREGEWIARILVEEVRGAPGMALVTGRHIKHEDENDEPPNSRDDKQARSTRIVLAGSPRIIGLEKKQEVRPGAVVGVGRPTWEISLPGQGRWNVVCEWAILR